jgi:hypothetical protein
MTFGNAHDQNTSSDWLSPISSVVEGQQSTDNFPGKAIAPAAISVTHVMENVLSVALPVAGSQELGQDGSREHYRSYSTLQNRLDPDTLLMLQRS